jgi:NAD(P)-dependent dehydrogenase (short-subunit alcohol dehydrogenase family)
MQTLTGIAAIVTGGASGLGAETARILAGQGAKVALFDRDEAMGKALANEIGGIAIACDVSDAKSAEVAMEKAKAAHGIARICVNCAGVAPPEKMIGHEQVMPLENFQQVININLIGTFNIMRLAAFAMTGLPPVGGNGERGVIINTASIAAYEGQIGQTAYSASKGGIVGLTLPAARELARHGIRVMTIAPGIMSTPMMAGMPQNVQDSLNAAVPFPSRMGKPSEFAGLVLHIIQNEYLNGAVIRLDGAIRMQPK